jgi:hypothetical protein
LGSFEGKQRRKSGYYIAAAFFVITILILKGPQTLFHAIYLPDNNAVAYLGWLPQVGNIMSVGVYSSSPGLWMFKLSGIELHKLVNISSELGGIISYIIATAHFIIFGYWIGWRWPVCFQPRIRLIKSTFARYGLFFMLNIVIGLAVSIFGLS